jgi:hypothetical protein
MAAGCPSAAAVARQRRERGTTDREHWGVSALHAAPGTPDDFAQLGHRAPDQRAGRAAAPRAAPAPSAVEGRSGAALAVPAARLAARVGHGLAAPPAPDASKASAERAKRRKQGKARRRGQGESAAPEGSGQGAASLVAALGAPGGTAGASKFAKNKRHRRPGRHGEAPAAAR